MKKVTAIIFEYLPEDMYFEDHWLNKVSNKT